MLLNPWSLVNKIDRVMMEISDQGVDFAGICETWMKGASNPTTAVIKSYGYDLIHTTREGKKGGGTALIFKRGYSASAFRPLTRYTTFEYTAACIKTTNGTSIMFLIVYRPGAMSSNFNDEIEKLLSHVLAKCDVLVLAGDLNIHFDQSGNKLYKQALETLSSFGLQQKVFTPTHIAGGALDQIFTYSQHNQLTCDVSVDNTNSIVGSDHFPVHCTLSLTFERKYFKQLSYRKLRGIDTNAFEIDLSAIVSNCINITSFPNALQLLKGSCESLLDEYAPVVTKRVSTVDSAPWFDKEYRELRKVRRKLERIARKSNATWENKVAHRDACSECTALALIKKKQFFGNMIDRSQNNPKTLYKLVNKVLDRKQEKPLPDYTSDMSELASDFNSFFVRKVKEIRSSMPETSTPVLEDELPEMSLLHTFKPTTADEIKEIISDSGFKCSPSDILPLKLLKQNFETLLPLLVELVNLSMASGSMEGVKEADIIPLLKSDSLDKNVLKNFRPVSNLMFVGKLIERVVLKRLNGHMSRNNLHIPEQSAYKKDHSTETLLVRIWNDLLVASEEKSATVVMMLDLSAAFDTVDHDLLLRILKKEIGLRGTALDWFGSFLKGRSQRVRLGMATSEEVLIMFGVPQGSVLGPVLFNIYIRSIYRFVQSLNFNIHGYADDHQVSKCFKPSAQGVVLTHDIRCCFDKIQIWMNEYFLQMNDSKTQIIVYGPPRVLAEIGIGGINFESGTCVRFVSSVKNLGIHMDSALTLRTQIIDLKKKCFRTIRNINKIRILLSTEQRKQVVNSLVVSCLDYCNSLYYGVSGKLHHQLQLIQNACSKSITGKYKHDHLENDLESLHWLNIKKRVLFKLGLLAYKAVNGFAPDYLQELFSYSHHGHSLKLMVPHFKLERYGRRSFSSIGPRLYNALPLHVTTCPTVTAFKSALKTYLFGLSDYEVENLC